MVLSLTVTRPKLALSNNVPISISLANPVEDSGNNKYSLRGLLDNLAPNRTIPPVTGCSYGIGDNVIVAVAGAFADVRLGDTVAGDDIAAATYVTAIASDASSITINNPTENLATVTGTGSVTVTAKTIDATIFMLDVAFTVSGNNLVITPTMHEFDGTKAFEGADSDGADEVTVSDASRSEQLTPFIINVDAYLTNARLDRTN